MNMSEPVRPVSADDYISNQYAQIEDHWSQDDIKALQQRIEMCRTAFSLRYTVLSHELKQPQPNQKAIDERYDYFTRASQGALPLSEGDKSVFSKSPNKDMALLIIRTYMTMRGNEDLISLDALKNPAPVASPELLDQIRHDRQTGLTRADNAVPKALSAAELKAEEDRQYILDSVPGELMELSAEAPLGNESPKLIVSQFADRAAPPVLGVEVQPEDAALWRTDKLDQQRKDLIMAAAKMNRGELGKYITSTFEPAYEAAEAEIARRYNDVASISDVATFRADNKALIDHANIMEKNLAVLNKHARINKPGDELAPAWATPSVAQPVAQVEAPVTKPSLGSRVSSWFSKKIEQGQDVIDSGRALLNGMSRRAMIIGAGLAATTVMAAILPAQLGKNEVTHTEPKPMPITQAFQQAATPVVPTVLVAAAAPTVEKVSPPVAVAPEPAPVKHAHVTKHHFTPAATPVVVDNTPLEAKPFDILTMRSDLSAVTGACNQIKSAGLESELCRDFK